jgi:hypothetical protein
MWTAVRQRQFGLVSEPRSGKIASVDQIDARLRNDQDQRTAAPGSVLLPTFRPLRRTPALRRGPAKRKRSWDVVLERVVRCRLTH